LAGISRHGFFFGMTAVRASDFWVLDHIIHFNVSLRADGYAFGNQAQINLINFPISWNITKWYRFSKVSVILFCLSCTSIKQPCLITKRTWTFTE
jgi:hypothetical protein